MIRNISHRITSSYNRRDVVYEHASEDNVQRIIEEVKLIKDGLSPLPPKKQTPTLQIREDGILQKKRVQIAL